MNLLLLAQLNNKSPLPAEWHGLTTSKDCHKTDTKWKRLHVRPSCEGKCFRTQLITRFAGGGYNWPVGV
eukprot:2037712-Amphidinium_carterae.1